MSSISGFPHDYRSKIGDWDLRTDYIDKVYTATFDLESYIQKMLNQMREIEEGAATEALIQVLRERGYTIVRPEDA